MAPVFSRALALLGGLALCSAAAGDEVHEKRQLAVPGVVTTLIPAVRVPSVTSVLPQVVAPVTTKSVAVLPVATNVAPAAIVPVNTVPVVIASVATSIIPALVAPVKTVPVAVAPIVTSIVPAVVAPITTNPIAVVPVVTSLAPAVITPTATTIIPGSAVTTIFSTGNGATQTTIVSSHSPVTIFESSTGSFATTVFASGVATINTVVSGSGSAGLTVMPGVNATTVVPMNGVGQASTTIAAVVSGVTTSFVQTGPAIIVVNGTQTIPAGVMSSALTIIETTTVYCSSATPIFSTPVVAVPTSIVNPAASSLVGLITSELSAGVPASSIVAQVTSIIAQAPAGSGIAAGLPGAASSVLGGSVPTNVASIVNAVTSNVIQAVPTNNPVATSLVQVITSELAAGVPSPSIVAQVTSLLANAPSGVAAGLPGAATTILGAAVPTNVASIINAVTSNVLPADVPMATSLIQLITSELSAGVPSPSIVAQVTSLLAGAPTDVAGNLPAVATTVLGGAVPSNVASIINAATSLPAVMPDSPLATSLVNLISSDLAAGVSPSSIVAVVTSLLGQAPTGVAADLPGAATSLFGGVVPSNAASIINQVTSQVLPTDVVGGAPLATSLVNLISSDLAAGVAPSSIAAAITSMLAQAPSGAAAGLPAVATSVFGGLVPSDAASIINQVTSQALPTGVVGGAPIATSIVNLISSDLAAGISPSSILAAVTSALGAAPTNAAAGIPGAATSVFGGIIPSDAASIINQIPGGAVPTTVLQVDSAATSLAGLITSQLSAGVPAPTIVAEVTSLLGNSPVGSSIAGDLPGALTSILGGQVPSEAASLVNQVTSQVLPTTLPFDAAATSLVGLITSELSMGVPPTAVAAEVTSILGDSPIGTSIAADLPGALTTVLNGQFPTGAAGVVDQITSQVLPTKLPYDPLATSLIDLLTSQLSAGVPAGSVVAVVTSLLGENPAVATSIAADLPGALTTALAGSDAGIAGSVVNQITSAVLPTQVIPVDPLATSIINMIASDMSMGIPADSIIAEVTSILGENPAVATSIAVGLPGVLTTAIIGAVPTGIGSVIDQVTSAILPAETLPLNPVATSLVNVITSELMAGVPAPTVVAQITSILGEDPAAATGIAGDLPGALTTMLGGNIPTAVGSVVDQITSDIIPTETLPVDSIATSLVNVITSELMAGVPAPTVVAQITSLLGENPAVATSIAADLPDVLTTVLNGAVPTAIGSVVDQITSQIIPTETLPVDPIATSLINLISSELSAGVPASGVAADVTSLLGQNPAIATSIAGDLPGVVTDVFGGAVPTEIATVVNQVTSAIIPSAPLTAPSDPLATSLIGLITSEISAGVPVPTVVAEVTSILGQNPALATSIIGDLPGAVTSMFDGSIPTEIATAINQITSEILPTGLPADGSLSPDPAATSLIGLITSELSAGVPAPTVIAQVTSLLGGNPLAATSVAGDLPGVATSLFGGLVPTEVASVVNGVTGVVLPTTVLTVVNGISDGLLPTDVSLSPDPAATSLVGLITSELSVGVPASSIIAQVTSLLGGNPLAATSVAADLPGVATSVFGGAIPTEVATVVNGVTNGVLPTDVTNPIATSLVGLITSELSAGVPAPTVIAQVTSLLGNNPSDATGIAGELPGVATSVFGGVVPTEVATVVNGITEGVLPTGAADPIATSLVGLITSELSAGVPAPTVIAQVTSLLGKNPSDATAIAGDLPGVATSVFGGAIPTELASVINGVTDGVLPTGAADPIATSLVGLITSELSAGVPGPTIVAQVTSILGSNPLAATSVVGDLPGVATSVFGGAVPTEVATVVNGITGGILPTNIADPMATSLVGLITSELSAGVPAPTIVGQITSLLGDNPLAATSVAGDLQGVATSMFGQLVPTEVATIINGVTSEVLPTKLPGAGDAIATSLAGLITSELSGGVPVPTIVAEVTSLLGNNPAAATSIAGDLPNVLTSAFGGAVPTEVATVINGVTGGLFPTGVSTGNTGLPGAQNPVGCPATAGNAALPTMAALQISGTGISGNSFVTVVAGALIVGPANSASPFTFTSIVGSSFFSLAGNPASDGSLPLAFLDTSGSTSAPRIVLGCSDPSGLGAVLFAVNPTTGDVVVSNAASGLNALAVNAAGDIVLVSSSNVPSGIRLIRCNALAALIQTVAVPVSSAPLNLPSALAPTTLATLVLPASATIPVGSVATVPVGTTIPVQAVPTTTPAFVQPPAYVPQVITKPVMTAAAVLRRFF